MHLTHWIARITSFAFALIFTLTSQAEEPEKMKTYTYRARVPALSLSCADEARALGERFARATQLEVTSAECVDTVTSPHEPAVRLHVLLLTYRAEREAVPYSALFGRANSHPQDEPKPYHGAYADDAECLADIPLQTQIFEESTGLVAVHAGCDPGTVNKTSRVLSIHGFGQTEARLHHFQGFPVGTDTEIMGQVRRLLTRDGSRIARESSGSFYYYGPRKAKIEHTSLGSFRIATECESQIGEGTSILQGAGAKVVIPACVPSPYGPVISLQLVSDRRGLITDDGGYEYSDYYSFNECLRDKDRALNRARSGSSRILGALCRPDFGNSSYFKLYIYSVY